jgi:hypothetical protein
MGAMAAKRQLRSEELFTPSIVGEGELWRPVDARNPALDLQRMLADRLLSEGEQMEFVLPQRSMVAMQIESMVSQVSRYAGPALLACAGLGLGALIF